MNLRRAKKRSVILNVTSLIDVLFLLLIFFIVSTTFLNQPAIKLELPKAKHSDAVTQRANIVYIDREGRVYLNDEPMEVPLLGEALSQRLDETEDRSVIMKADSRVSHGSVVEVLDIIKSVGVKKLTISTKVED